MSIQETAVSVAGAAGTETAAAQAEAWVAEFIEGWRAPKSADAFADHFERVSDPKVRLIQPQMPTMVGHTAFRERFVKPLFEVFEDLHADVHRWAARDDLVFIEFTLTGRLGGKPVSWQVVDRILLREGLAVERQAYFDPAPILRAVATRPRTWPSFLRVQTRQLLQSRKKGSA